MLPTMFFNNTAVFSKVAQIPPDAIAFPTEHLLSLQIKAADEPNAVSSKVGARRHVNAA